MKFSAGVDLADFTFLTGLDFFAIGDVVTVFFNLVGLLRPKFFVPFVGVLTSGRIFQSFSASSCDAELGARLLVLLDSLNS